VLVSVADRTPLNGIVTSMLRVGSAQVTGTATVPAGATVTATNEDTGQTMELRNGLFSFATSAGNGRSYERSFAPAARPGMAMTGPAWPGRPVRLDRSTGSAAQVWEVGQPGSGSHTEIINKRTGLCLSAARHTAGTELTTALCDGSKHQRWAERRRPDGSWRISQTRSGQVLQAAVSGRDRHVRLKPLGSPAKARSWLRRAP
jgi:hypothetical protein